MKHNGFLPLQTGGGLGTFRCSLSVPRLGACSPLRLNRARSHNTPSGSFEVGTSEEAEASFRQVFGHAQMLTIG